jgi:GTP-binding protein
LISKCFLQIAKHVPPPVVRTEGQFSMLVTSVEYDNYVGKVCTGRVYSGVAKPGDILRPVDRNGMFPQSRHVLCTRMSNSICASRSQISRATGKAGEPMKVMKVFCRRGTLREELQEARAGDIVSVAGVNGMVGDTLTDAGMFLRHPRAVLVSNPLLMHCRVMCLD